MGIKHRADSGFRKFRVVRKLCLGGQVSSFEMPYVSYPNLVHHKMEAIKSKIENLASRINAPKEYLPTYGFSEDFAKPHIEVNDNEFHWVVVERGQELERRQTTDEKELLFWVFDSVTFEMATRLELENRNENEDFRIQLFKIQEELIGEINSDYSDRLNIKHRKLLNI